jgi:hypothetical protein
VRLARGIFAFATSSSRVSSFKIREKSSIISQQKLISSSLNLPRDLRSATMAAVMLSSIIIFLHPSKRGVPANEQLLQILGKRD